MLYHRRENAPPIPVREIETQSANTHLIPMSKPKIAKQSLKAKLDQDEFDLFKRTVGRK